MALVALTLATPGCQCCGSHPSSTPPPQGSRPGAPASPDTLATLQGRELTLHRLVADGHDVALTGVQALTLRFQEAGRISGRAAVNRYSGTFQLGPHGTVSWPGPGLAMTRMAGPEPAMKLETRFTQALTATTRLLLPEGGARFEDASGSNVLEFRTSEPGPAAPR